MLINDCTERVTHTIPLARAVLCVSCNTVSDSVGDRCQACAGVGGLLSLSRVLARPTVRVLRGGMVAAGGAR